MLYHFINVNANACKLDKALQCMNFKDLCCLPWEHISTNNMQDLPVKSRINVTADAFKQKACHEEKQYTFFRTSMSKKSSSKKNHTEKASLSIKHSYNLY